MSTPDQILFYSTQMFQVKFTVHRHRRSSYSPEMDKQMIIYRQYLLLNFPPWACLTKHCLVLLNVSNKVPCSLGCKQSFCSPLGKQISIYCSYHDVSYCSTPLGIRVSNQPPCPTPLNTECPQKKNPNRRSKRSFYSPRALPPAEKFQASTQFPRI